MKGVGQDMRNILEQRPRSKGGANIYNHNEYGISPTKNARASYGGNAMTQQTAQPNGSQIYAQHAMSSPTGIRNFIGNNDNYGK